MIEFILDDKCTACGICYDICPADVFDKTADGKPIIARQEDCQTCRQCDIRCPETAIYVSLFESPNPAFDKERIIAEGRMHAYARWLGWEKGQPPGGDINHGENLRVLRGEEVPDPSDRVRSQLYSVIERTLIDAPK